MAPKEDRRRNIQKEGTLSSTADKNVIVPLKGTGVPVPLKRDLATLDAIALKKEKDFTPSTGNVVIFIERH